MASSRFDDDLHVPCPVALALAEERRRLEEQRHCREAFRSTWEATPRRMWNGPSTFSYTLPKDAPSPYYNDWTVFSYRFSTTVVDAGLTDFEEMKRAELHREMRDRAVLRAVRRGQRAIRKRNAHRFTRWCGAMTPRHARRHANKRMHCLFGLGKMDLGGFVCVISNGWVES